MVRLLAAAVGSPLSGSDLVRLAAGKRIPQNYDLNSSEAPRVLQEGASSGAKHFNHLQENPARGGWYQVKFGTVAHITQTAQTM